MDLISTIAGETIKALFSLLGKKKLATGFSREQVFDKISMHLTEVLNWGQQVQFYGMSHGEQTEEVSIQLTLDTIPRRFRGDQGGKPTQVDERYVLRGQNHYVLLGGPGSGKTTTIKRLSRFILLEPPSLDEEAWSYPIVIRLREHPKRKLIPLIADCLGVAYEMRVQGGVPRGARITEDISEAYVGEVQLKSILPEILDSTKAILFLDGLDEVETSRRVEIERDIGGLALHLSSGKIILSCRSGDYTRPLSNFDLVEICPLEVSQVEDICSRWLDDPEKFIHVLSDRPYRDLASRPLFLCYLIVLYRNAGDLPDRSADVYQKIVRLALERWDQERGIKRKSKYSRFDPDRKLDFLAALSYFLTYRVKVKRFRAYLLEMAYREICRDFDLPENEAEEVALELETHTGILLESGAEFYEFSHLSIQEYLCAYYLVREPFADFMINYINEYPAPVAIAVSLAASSSNWFSAILLGKNYYKKLDEGAVSVLFSRLLQEKPIFSQSSDLGLAMLLLIFQFRPQVEPYLDELFEQEGVVRSFIESVALFKIEDRGSLFHFDLVEDHSTRYNLEAPRQGEIPKELLLRLARVCGLQHEYIFIDQKPCVLFRYSTRTAGGKIGEYI